MPAKKATAKPKVIKLSLENWKNINNTIVEGFTEHYVADHAARIHRKAIREFSHNLIEIFSDGLELDIEGNVVTVTGEHHVD